MKNRIQYAITFIVFFLTEVAIAKWGTGFVRSYVGDILVIPTIYFFLRAVIFAKDGIFSVYVLPFLTYALGWIAEVLQAFHFVEKMGISKDSPIGIALGGVFDLRDGLCYLLGLFLIGLYLAVESLWREDRRWYYPLAVFIHWTWGNAQTMLGFFIYLWYRKSRHFYYRGVVRTVWPSSAGLSLGMFIFTPKEPSLDDKSLSAQADREYCERVAVHEYGHTIQALLLGPLYLLVIGIPSVCWAGLPKCQKIRQDKHIPYTRFYCEKWASRWGEKVTKDKADWN